MKALDKFLLESYDVTEEEREEILEKVA